MNYAIILSADKGNRMKANIPKCGISILGKPMISYIVDEVKKTRIDEIICVVGYKKEYIYEILKDSVTYKYQANQLGSADAVKCCRGLVGDGYTIILNGDTPLIDMKLINEIIDFHLCNNNDLTIVSVIKDNPYGYGRIIRNSNNDIIDIVEEIELDNNLKSIKEINCGIYCVKTKALFEAIDKINNDNLKKEYYLTDIVKHFKNHKIGSYNIDNEVKVLGANTLADLSKIEEELRLSIINKHLKNGVKIEGINNVLISKDAIIEDNVEIRNSTILGNSTICSGSSIVNSEIRNSTIFNNTSVEYSVVNDSIIGNNCMVGPFSNIRNNSIIIGNNRIGNFVEVKNSKIGENSKLSHLAYMGDTTCGNNVNFGCGSITVNYDGKNKHKTYIGNNVFIGCNTNLIAPIEIEDDSFIAAGSTIVEDLDKGDFAIARSMQVTKKGYASKYE